MPRGPGYALNKFKQKGWYNEYKMCLCIPVSFVMHQECVDKPLLHNIYVLIVIIESKMVLDYLHLTYTNSMSFIACRCQKTLDSYIHKQFSLLFLNEAANQKFTVSRRATPFLRGLLSLSTSQKVLLFWLLLWITYSHLFPIPTSIHFHFWPWGVGAMLRQVAEPQWRRLLAWCPDWWWPGATKSRATLPKRSSVLFSVLTSEAFMTQKVVNLSSDLRHHLKTDQKVQPNGGESELVSEISSVQISLELWS